MTCDVCHAETTPSEWVEVRLERPSDPHDLCCVLVGCPDCADKLPGAKTADEWQTYIESDEAREAEHWFLT